MTSKTSFEQAITRLEQILEKMNSNAVTLEDSIALYEEADTLISLCTEHLNKAEQKIEMLIKNKQGDLQLDKSGQPAAQPFNIGSETY